MENSKKPETPESIKTFISYRLKYGDPLSNGVNKEMLNQFRDEILNSLSQYKKLKSSFFRQEEERNELRQWAKENNINFEENGK